MSYRHTDPFDEELARRFRASEEASEFVLLPADEYIANAIRGAFDTTKNGVPEFKVEFEISEGFFVGQRLWLHLYLSEKALPISKRDLKKFGITDLAQVRDGWPGTWRCRVKVSVQTSDSGNESNRTQLLEVLSRLDPGPEPFAPTNGHPASVPATAPKPSAAEPVLPEEGCPF